MDNSEKSHSDVIEASYSMLCWPFYYLNESIAIWLLNPYFNKFRGDSVYIESQLTFKNNIFACIYMESKIDLCHLGEIFICTGWNKKKIYLNVNNFLFTPHLL